LGRIIPTDFHIFSEGLKPPTSVRSCKKCGFIIASVQSEAAGEIVGEIAGGWVSPPEKGINGLNMVFFWVITDLVKNKWGYHGCINSGYTR
jgi:hypothetical protein